MTISALLAASLLAVASLSHPPIAGGVNFANFSYPAPPCGINDDKAPPFTLTNGYGSWDDDRAKEGLTYQLALFTSGALRADGSVQAVVVLGCDMPNPSFFNQWILLYDVRGKNVKLIAQLPGGDENGPVEKVRILDRRLYVDRGLNTEACSKACATNEVTTYRLLGATVSVLARRRYAATPGP